LSRWGGVRSAVKVSPGSLPGLREGGFLRPPPEGLVLWDIGHEIPFMPLPIDEKSRRCRDGRRRRYHIMMAEISALLIPEGEAQKRPKQTVHAEQTADRWRQQRSIQQKSRFLPSPTNPKRSGWKRWFFQRRCGKLNPVFRSLPCTSLVKRYDLGYAPEWFLS